MWLGYNFFHHHKYYVQGNRKIEKIDSKVGSRRLISSRKNLPFSLILLKKSQSQPSSTLDFHLSPPLTYKQQQKKQHCKTYTENEGSNYMLYLGFFHFD